MVEAIAVGFFLKYRQYPTTCAENSIGLLVRRNFHKVACMVCFLNTCSEVPTISLISVINK